MKRSAPITTLFVRTLLTFLDIGPNYSGYLILISSLFLILSILFVLIKIYIERNL